MRRPVILVTGALGLVALGLGVTLGARYARLDEGTVIAAYAARYAEETGGRPGDCVARPGTGRVWITIRCTGEETRVFAVSRWGTDLGHHVLRSGEI